jgi:pantothenate kinase type III
MKLVLAGLFAVVASGAVFAFCKAVERVLRRYDWRYAVDLPLGVILSGFLAGAIASELYGPDWYFLVIAIPCSAIVALWGSLGDC